MWRIVPLSLLLACTELYQPAASQTPLAATPPTPQERYFSGLRERGLYETAERVCREELDRKDLDSASRLQLTLEFSRTLTEHAQLTDGQQQRELWTQAQVVLDGFQTSYPAHPEITRVHLQAALVPLAQADYLARQVETSPFDLRRRGMALESLQSSLLRLARIQQQLETNRSLSSPLRKQLLVTVYWRRVRAHLTRGGLLKPGTPDRAAELLSAETTLRQITSSTLEPIMRQEQRRLQARIARMRGDFQKARRLLTSPVTKDDRHLAERTWTELEDQKLEAAEVLLRGRFLERQPPTAELHFLHLVCLDRLWTLAQRTGRPELATGFAARLETQATLATRVSDPYWSTRAIDYWNLARAIRQYGPAVAKARHRAEGLFRAGLTDEALDAYALAGNAADKSGQTRLAISLAFTRGSILLKAGRHDTAANVFDKLARRQPAHQHSATSHLLWAWCLGRRFRNKPTGEHRQAFQTALTAHRTQYPRSQTFGEATWLLADLFESARLYDQARGLFAQVPIGHTRRPEATLGIARCWEQELQNLDGDKAQRAQRRTTAIVQLEQMIADFPEAATRWTIPETDLAIRLARLRLNADPPGFAQADALLRIALTRGPISNSRVSNRAADLRAAARQLRTLSLAGQGRLSEARELVSELAAAGPTELLALLDGLDRLAVATQSDARRDLGNVQLQATTRLQQRRQELTADQQRRLDHCHGQALLATGQADQAVALFARLVQARPRDARLREELARTRAQIGSRGQLELALTDWRETERLYESGSNDWLRIRLESARTLHQLKRFDECRKLLNITRLLYPNAGTPKTRAGLQSLQRSLAASP